MIKSLHIQNFKNLVDLQLPALSRINLISGRNNVGKSTLLEALRLFLSDAQLPEILNSRGEITASAIASRYDNPVEIRQRNHMALASLFTGRNSSVSPDNVIHISDGENQTSIRFFYYIQQPFENNSQTFSRITAIENPSEHQDHEVFIGFEINRNNENSIRISLDRNLRNIRYLQTGTGTNDTEKLICVSHDYDNSGPTSRLWDNISLTDKEDDVIKALQIIEPGIENIAFPEDSYSRTRYPIVKINGHKGRAPLRSMGDGINHILSIVLAIVNAENGCVIIDEIDNGLHYTVQKQLWTVIFELSKSLNVQIFATTHSSDCISSFSKVLQQPANRDEGRFIRLEMKNGAVSSTEYNPDELEIVASQNIEIR
ncbi:AAA family ATPase [Duncaniella muris]|uniref:AAA family ATPase n=1 Tax=Duncaniella muris TaxID=2094150 RepID=UPI00272A555F|nr:AAA family ATPase [Duncaniella muris]